jgi:hypothetical protein
MIDTISKCLLFAATVAVILVFGWKQPLRYRFMSHQQIYAEQNPATPIPATPAWMAERERTLLDRAPYRTRRADPNPYIGH